MKSMQELFGFDAPENAVKAFDSDEQRRAFFGKLENGTLRASVDSQPKHVQSFIRSHAMTDRPGELRLDIPVKGNHQGGYTLELSAPHQRALDELVSSGAAKLNAVGPGGARYAINLTNSKRRP